MLFEESDPEQDRLDLRLLSYKIDLESFEPSRRNVLYLIGKYRFAFSIAGVARLRERFYTKELPSNVSAFHKIAAEMAEKRFIDMGLGRVRITLKGRWYQFYSHPANWLLAILIGTAVTLAGDKFVAILGETKQSQSPTSKPIGDSLLHRQKK